MNTLQRGPKHSNFHEISRLSLLLYIESGEFWFLEAFKVIEAWFAGPLQPAKACAEHSASYSFKKFSLLGCVGDFLLFDGAQTTIIHNLQKKSPKSKRTSIHLL